MTRRREQESRREALLAQDGVRRLLGTDPEWRLALPKSARRRADVVEGLYAAGHSTPPQWSPFSAAARPVEPSPPPARAGHTVRVCDRRGETLAATFDARDLHRRRGTRGLVERLRRW